MDDLKGSCVGCGEITANAIACGCTRGIAACGACRETDDPVRCAGCRLRRQRQSAYPCLDYRDDPASGGDTGGRLPVAAVGAWGLPGRAE